MSMIPEMDEFVDWDNAAAASTAGTADLLSGLPVTNSHLNDLDLVLENVDGDDFSFWALEHFEASNPGLASSDPMLGDDVGQPQTSEHYLGTPDAPCAHCQRGGFVCKTINEGKFRGYCTSCVALRCECSFGLASHGTTPSATFPANPWPTLGDHPGAILQEDIQPDLLHSRSVTDLTALTAAAGPQDSGTMTSVPKIGARFSKESVRILKNWLSTHTRHPYPTEDEKAMLQKQTGLNKIQITNWLANARRRGRIAAPRSTSPGVRRFYNAIDIPQRRGTPSLENMKPLDRWKNSPPEHEPASVTDIARAIASSSNTISSSGLDSPYSANFTDDGSNRSLWAGSSASSAHTSHSSGGSFASAFSHGSRGSHGSFGSLSINRGRRRRRRKAAPKRPDDRTSLSTPLKTFMCTFCTETFRTKHDWQRHEKSLHLSLERWVCAPDGPRALNPENNEVCCVFCGEANPDDAHVESHNHTACQERSLEERTFYRKDHLNQHLKLVHGVKFVAWSMEPWKVATPEIRSRCGFCGIVMDTWSIRVDHLAEHFKTGNTMADWKGDWGFEAPVLEMVENSIPPYLIHDERNSPLPYKATEAPPESPRNAYELLKGELLFYMTNVQDSTGKLPTDEQLQLEACRIIYGADVLSTKSPSPAPSWLRDLLLSSEQLARQAQLAPIRRQNESRSYYLKVNGKDNIFEDDPMERQLQEYVKARSLLGLTALDSELQVEACNILGRVEESSGNPSDDVANFLLRLVLRSTEWLAAFRQRASLPRSEDIMDVNLRSKDPTTIDSTIHNYSRLESELAEFVKAKREAGLVPNDSDLQRQARLIIYEFDDGWNQTAADNADWLNAFKQRHLRSSDASPSTDSSSMTSGLLYSSSLHKPSDTVSPATATVTAGTGSVSTPTTSSTGGTRPPVRLGAYFLNDANCYRRLARELKRYVASTMSPNNPNCHVPSDEELQHQARWILYDSDDTWNQTAADNAEWLQRFKKDAGIITDESLPGLPECTAWSIAQGGSGFAPPYALPNQSAAVLTSPQTDRIEVPVRGDGATRIFETEYATVNKYLQALADGRFPPPATVFCSRELENGLVEFVTAKTAPLGLGQFPSDEAIRAKAREVLGTPNTPADDPVLLDKFKGMMREKLGLGLDLVPAGQAAFPSSTTAAQTFAATSAGGGLPTAALDIDLPLSDNQVADILQDMDFEFGELTGLNDPLLGTGFGGHGM